MTSYITFYDIIDIDDIDEIVDTIDLFQHRNDFFKVSVTGDEPRYGNSYKGMMKIAIVPNFSTIGNEIDNFSNIISNFAELSDWECQMGGVADLSKYEIENFRTEIKSINLLIDKLLSILS